MRGPVGVVRDEVAGVGLQARRLALRSHLHKPNHFALEPAEANLVCEVVRSDF